MGLSRPQSAALRWLQDRGGEGVSVPFAAATMGALARKGLAEWAYDEVGASLWSLTDAGRAAVPIRDEDEKPQNQEMR